MSFFQRLVSLHTLILNFTFSIAAFGKAARLLGLKQGKYGIVNTHESATGSLAHLVYHSSDYSIVLLKRTPVDNQCESCKLFFPSPKLYIEHTFACFKRALPTHDQIYVGARIPLRAIEFNSAHLRAITSTDNNCRRCGILHPKVHTGAVCRGNF
jgi:hypothetical protein